MVDFAFNVTECSKHETWSRLLSRRPNTVLLRETVDGAPRSLESAIKECSKLATGSARLFASSNATSNGTVGFRLDDSSTENISYQYLLDAASFGNSGTTNGALPQLRIELIIWACSFGRFEVAQLLLRRILGSHVSAVRAPKFPLWTDEISGACVEYLALPVKVRFREEATVREQELLDLVEDQLGNFRSSMPDEIDIACRELLRGGSSSEKTQRYAVAASPEVPLGLFSTGQPETLMCWYSRRRVAEFVLDGSTLVDWSIEKSLAEKLSLRTLDGVCYYQTAGFETVSEALSRVSWEPIKGQIGTWKGRSNSFEFAIPICENDGSLMCNMWTMEGEQKYLVNRLSYDNDLVFRTIS